MEVLITSARVSPRHLIMWTCCNVNISRVLISTLLLGFSASSSSGLSPLLHSAQWRRLYSLSSRLCTSLNAGIVGLPNIGKSTCFSAVVENGKAQAANGPQISKFGSKLNPSIANDLIVHLSNHFATLLEACNGATDLPKGCQIHAQIIANGLNSILSARVLDMYVLCQSLSDAKDVFYRVDRGSSFPWNRMIMGFNMMGLFDFALLFYFKMRVAGVSPDKYTFTHVIKSCRGLSTVNLGRLIHGTIRSIGLEQDPFVGSSLIMMYAASDCIGDAREVFDRMPEKDCVLWNVMIDGYKRIGDKGNAIRLFDRMRMTRARPNSVSFTTVLSVCAAEAMLSYGIQLHGMAIKCGMDLDVSVANTLLALYSKCRCSSDVNMLFSTMVQNDLVAWNGMISGCVQNGLKDEALDFFYRMQSSGVKPDSVTLTSFLPTFSNSASLKQGKEIHAYILRNGITIDAFLMSALIDIYLKGKNVDMAQKVFESTRTVDVVIFSAMISGYVLNGLNYDALEMFRQLVEVQLKPNAVALANVLPACSGLTAIRLGKELHGYILKNALVGRCFLESALMDMYAKCGRLDRSYQIFKNMSERDVVAWNSMISNFAQNAQLDEAITLFRRMGAEGMRYDCVTISSTLSACGNLPSLRYGKEIHGFITRWDLGSDLFVESALIDMYAKCGDLDLARCVFESMKEKSEVSWNSIIAAYGTHGLINDAVNLFMQMEELGFRPDHITFLHLISSCGHAGKVEDGIKFFHCMSKEYGIRPRMEHYACMIDLFGRAGRLDEALHFILDMPFKPDAGIWGAVLGACRVNGNVELAELASKHLFEMDPQNSGYYVLMSNINAVAGRWEGVSRVRSLMKERRVEKVPGYSWIEINNTNHMFVSADNSHPDTVCIYLCMKSLYFELEDEGYVPKYDITYPLRMK